MNVYKEFEGIRYMPEQELYKQLYDMFIKRDELTYLGRILEHSAHAYPDITALICDNRSMTYKEFYHRAVKLSLKLQGMNIKRGQRIVLLMENSIEFYIAYFGIVQIGALVVPVNTFLGEKELEHIIKDSEPACIICFSSRIEKIHRYAIDLPPLLDETALELEKPMEQLPDFQITDLPFDDMVALLYTSGTTGFPKAVMLSSKNILTNVLQVVARFGFIERQRVMAVLPLFHSLAQNICLWASLLMGCTVIIVSKIERRALLKGFAQKPTLFVGVPALYGLMCLMKTIPLASVDYFFSGGDALPDKVRAAFSLIYRRKICSGYGITESSPVVSVDMDDTIEPTNSTGTLLVGIECSIRDKHGAELSINKIGQLWIKGDNIMLGYYQAPEATASVIKDGWFDTGDLAYLDVHKKLVITGRVKDLIINKGINIYPQEVENVILLHANVIAVGVIGKPDPDSGQIPIAHVQIRTDESGIEEQIRELCQRYLATYKIPRQFIISTKALPTTATGKVDKKLL